MSGSKEEIYRLVRLNSELIIHLFKSESYDYLLIVDDELMPYFEKYRDYVHANVDECHGKKGIMLCMNKDERIIDIEKRFSDIKCVVLQVEYDRMNRQISVITKESIDAYKAMFGYSSIVYQGSGVCINRLREIYGKEELLISDGLCITEYIDTENNENCCTLGVRQFLFELEVFATFPAEIRDKWNAGNIFEKFIYRFCDIYEKTGWHILFSEKAPLIGRIIRGCKSSKVCYLDDANLDDCNKKKILLIQNGNLVGVGEFLRRYEQEYRIVVRRFIVLFRTWIMENLCTYFKDVLAKQGVGLYVVNWNWAMNHPLFPKERVTSVDINQREKYNLYNIKNNISSYEEFLKGIYGDKYSKEYVKELFNIPNKMELEPGKIRHENKNGQYIRVINGERYTVGQPENSQNSIYMMGGCVFFGYAVEDAHTISSYLQKNINENISERKWKVVNMGTWGGNIDQTYKQIYDLKFKNGDIVVVSYAGYMPIGDEYEKWDISTALDNSSIDEKVYFNEVVHCNKTGYKLVAQKLFALLQPRLTIKVENSEEEFYIDSLESENYQTMLYSRQAQEYLDMVKKATPSSWKEGTIGAIVMNCNPFTLGHKYLICESAKKVDHLYIFVVEEDKSFFPFKDRIELVKAGTAEFNNVVVVPSGKLIISSVTFPGYFLKDSPDSIGVDTSMDVDIFAKYIAGPLRITKRFVGEEPLDIVTRSYNKSMKEILPRYKIQVDEISRKEMAGKVISASRVRKALKDEDFDIISQLVPETTLNYLLKRKEWYKEVKI